MRWSRSIGAAAWTHALMDVGARVCRPAKPMCADCPAVAWCRYAAGERPAGERPAWKRAAGAALARHRRPEPRFESTNRWLRGRILERARDAEDGTWTPYADPIGTHGSRAVREAVKALASEGLLEARETAGGPEARLPR